jgi:hypothetical protein
MARQGPCAARNRLPELTANRVDTEAKIGKNSTREAVQTSPGTTHQRSPRARALGGDGNGRKTRRSSPCSVTSPSALSYRGCN